MIVSLEMSFFIDIFHCLLNVEKNKKKGYYGEQRKENKEQDNYAVEGGGTRGL